MLEPEGPGRSADDEARTARAAGRRALESADRALETDDIVTARAAYAAAAAHFRRAAQCAADAGDEGARRIDEAAAVNALHAWLPISE